MAGALGDSAGRPPRQAQPRDLFPGNPAVTSCKMGDSFMEEVAVYETDVLEDAVGSVKLDLSASVARLKNTRVTETQYEAMPFSRRLHQIWSFYLVTKPQLLLFIVLHSATTLAIFLHFFAKKWVALDASIPAAAPHFWQKHIVPPVEFGAMHTILWQMVFLPLSMCRHGITFLRGTPLNRYMPLDHLQTIHIFLGLSMFIQLILAFALFCFHFGSLCAWHKMGVEPVDGCAKFGIEIMITGYVILALVLVIGTSSMLRRRIKFELFKYTHYLFIPLYLVTILHTLDVVGRKSMHARSQSWFWLVVPLFLYTCDFLYGLFTVQKTAVCGGKLVDAPKGLLLRISRPATFQFEPGAYVRINVPAISRHEWHPYSIASAPRDRRWIELYVTAIPGGWTDQLYDHLAEHYAEEGTGQICEGLEVKLDGPMGSTFQDTSQQKTLVAVSSGSGAAPFLCLLRALNMTSKLVQSDEKNGNGFRDVGALASVKAAVRQPVQEQPLLQVPSSTMSTFQSVLGPVRSMVTGRTETGRMEGRHDKIAAFYDTLRLDAMYAAATKYCFTYAFFTAGACLDLFLLAISWSLHSNRETADWPYMTVGVLTAWLILLFGVNAVFTRLQRMHTNHSTVKVQDGTLLNNLVLWALMAAVCYCSFREEYKVSTGLLVASSLLRLFRLFWNLANTPLFLQKRNSEAQPVTFLQRVSFLWCTSVDMFRWIGPDLIALAQQLDDSCGTDYFHPYIFIRTASAEQQAEVAAMVAGTPLQGAVQFQISTGHMIVEEICTEVLAGSTLDGTVGIYFCGNGNLAQQLKKSVIVARHKYNVKNRPLVYGAENIY